MRHICRDNKTKKRQAKPLPVADKKHQSKREKPKLGERADKRRDNPYHAASDTRNLIQSRTTSNAIPSRPSSSGIKQVEV